MTDFDITATEHKTLNFSKGVIYCNELRNISETEILQELLTQNVTEVRKIMKKQQNNNNTVDNNTTLIETGLITITFTAHKLPESIKIGYESVRVRPYIPLPLRCKKCLRFGHPTPICKSSETCHNCSQQKHTNENELCRNEKTCLNCKNNPETDHQHSPLDRNCPTFLKQQELTAIKTTEKVDHKTALTIYANRHGQKLRTSYASTLANNAHQKAHNPPSSNTHTPTQIPSVTPHATSTNNTLPPHQNSLYASTPQIQIPLKSTSDISTQQH